MAMNPPGNGVVARLDSIQDTLIRMERWQEKHDDEAKKLATNISDYRVALEARLGRVENGVGVRTDGGILGLFAIGVVESLRMLGWTK